VRLLGTDSNCATPESKTVAAGPVGASGAGEDSAVGGAVGGAGLLDTELFPPPSPPPPQDASAIALVATSGAKKRRTVMEFLSRLERGVMLRRPCDAQTDLHQFRRKIAVAPEHGMP
jgi:hypothetical protein